MSIRRRLYSTLPLLFLGSLPVMGQARQEVVPPTEARDSATIVKMIEAAVEGAHAMGVRPAMRDAHAKGHGCVKATFTVEQDLPARLSHGVFAVERSYPAWIRFSNGAGTPHDDHVGDGRGMAIKLMDVPGKKLLADETDATTQDFVMINHPVFFIRNVSEYATFTRLSLADRSAEYFAHHPHEEAIIDAIKARQVGSMFDQHYFSMSPYRLGDQYIKFSARPVDCQTSTPIAESTLPIRAGDPDYLRRRMVARLDQRPTCFKFAVQPQTDPATQPVEDPTVQWNAPFIDVATIRIPQQKFESPAQQSFCESLSFTPWHALPSEAPVGGINRLRKVVYEAISQLRHRLNHAPRTEPTGTESFN